jgi:hypothetical protein
MARRQPDALLAPAGEEWLAADDEPVGMQWRRVAKAASISFSVPASRIGSCTPSCAPRPAARFMPAATARLNVKAAPMLTAKIRSQSASGTSSTGRISCPATPPALLTSTSIAPHDGESRQIPGEREISR